MNVKGYIGSYATNASTAILTFEFDEKKQQFTQVQKALPYKDSKYLSLYQHDFVSLMKEERAGIVLWHQELGTIEALQSEDITSCYVTQDERFIYTANYHEGHVMIYEKRPKLHLYKTIHIQEKAGCHQVLLQDRYMFVPCLLLDTIKIYDRNADFTLVKELPFPKGSGPRHGIFDHQAHFYVVSEISCQLFLFDVAQGCHMKLRKVVDLLKTGEDKAFAAALLMSRDERFLYISLRGVNRIVVYDVEQERISQSIDCGGDHPRDMAFTPDERYVFVLNRFTNNVCVFARHQDGQLTPCAATLHAVQGVSILFEKQEDSK